MLEEKQAGGLSISPGAGPRHCEFTPDGKVCYLINEIASEISALQYDGNGGFKLLQTVSSLAKGTKTANTCADIHLSPDGKFLYGSNRGDNSIVIYQIEKNGTLSFTDCQPCGGEIPRNFTLTPDGRFVLVANQDSNTIVVFERNEETGRLTQRSVCSVPTPVCVKCIVY